MAQSPNAPSEPSPLPLVSFQMELRTIQSELEAGPKGAAEIAAIKDRIPARWDIELSGHSYQVPTEQLRALLDRAVQNPSRQATLLQEAAEWTQELAAETNGYKTSGEQQPDARVMLKAILAAREFNMGYTQSGWDRLQQRFWAWIRTMLINLAERMSRYPIAAQGLFWLFLIGAVAGVALLVFRSWRRHARTGELKAPAPPGGTQTWQEWIRTARIAADDGSFRDAVHALYWAGTVYLEDSAIIPRERWQTPRERLRKLASSRNGDPAKQREALQALTGRLERVWYAGEPATRQDFLESLGLIETLGCRWQ